MTTSRQARQLLLLPLVVGLSMLSTTTAWGKTGHEIVGNLAWRLLPTAVQTQVVDVLRSDDTAHYGEDDPLTPLGKVADWADQVRYTKEYAWSAPLHFIDVHDDVLPATCQTTNSAACAFVWVRDCVQDVCVVGALRNYTHRLEAMAGANQSAAEALKFIVHFVGDVHQPLHVSRTSDKGGNSIAVQTNFTHMNTQRSPHSNLRVRGRRSMVSHHGTNLHGVWDSIMLETFQEEKCANNWTQLQEVVYELIDEISIKKWGRCADGGRYVCLDSWAQESWNLAQHVAYIHVNGSQIMNHDILPLVYYQRSIEVVLKQLAAASVRLARTLVWYLSEPSSSVSANES